MAKNKNSGQTFERILDVSEKLFLEKGYENTSIQDILDELGDLTKGAIYYYFKHKKEIFYAITNRIAQRDLII